MIGGWVRNVVIALLLLLWIYVAVDLNARLLALVSWYQNAEHIIYYLLLPAVVIVPVLIGLAFRWRRPFSGIDTILLGWPIILFPVYLLPLQ
nr:hypothetical protein [uncultured Sphingomonas sp.]